MPAELARLGKSALMNSDWQRLGELMNDNHRIQCELAGHGESNERLISAALDAGALGAKLAEGGTIIVLYPGEDSADLEDVLRDAGASAIFRPAIDFGAAPSQSP